MFRLLCIFGNPPSLDGGFSDRRLTFRKYCAKMQSKYKMDWYAQKRNVHLSISDTETEIFLP